MKTLRDRVVEIEEAALQLHDTCHKLLLLRDMDMRAAFHQTVHLTAEELVALTTNAETEISEFYSTFR